MTTQEARHALQAAGTHPAPCARHCESTAFHIDLRRLQSENEQLRAGYDAARLEIASLHSQMEAVGAGGVTALLPKAERKPLTDAEITSLYFESLGQQRIQDAALLAAERGFAQEPFGYFKAEPLCWTNCAETEEGAIALYDAPQPQQIAEPAQVTLKMIADILGTGSEARKNHATLIRCIENAIRRSDCLSRIERGFFMVPTDDDEDEEPGEECLLNWGQSPDDYAKQFGEALDAIIAARGTVQGQTACDVPPPGWRCTRMHGHEGPCAQQSRQKKKPS